MDSTGWHAQRRAQRDTQRYGDPHRGPDGRFQPVAQVLPLPDNQFAGGFHRQSPSFPPSPDNRSFPYNSDVPPPVPPKPPTTRDAQPGESPTTPTTSSSWSTLTNMSAVERSRALRVAHMDPYLQFMVGPLLRYDTVDEQGVWRGAALIVTADSGSIYEPHPMLKYEWDPNARSFSTPRRQSHRHGASSFDLGAHPADPHSTPILGVDIPAVDVATEQNGSNNSNGHSHRQAQTHIVPGHEIYVYAGNGGTFTFWRFLIQIPLGPREMRVSYSINNGMKLTFVVPGRHQNMRCATYSCNGFSAGVNPDDFRGPGFQSGYDPVWTDLLEKHAEQPFHVLVGGGDQLYCDGLTREPEMQEWVLLPTPEAKKTYPLTSDIAIAIDRFFFNHYCNAFRSGAFARANSQIPMVNMCDDHDGFGSYPDDLQAAPVFRTIGARGYFWFLLFQCFINVDADGLDDRPGQHSNASLILGGRGPWVSFPSHSFLTYLGPNVWMLLLDCRAERKKNQVCSTFEYEKVFERLRQLPPNIDHLIVQLGIPIAYPRMVFLETALETKYNPLVMLGRNGALGLGGFVNKFNSEAELLDDLNDHWTAKHHKKERNWFIEQLQQFARDKRVRVTFLSGDVHCAAVGVLKTLVHTGSKRKQDDVSPAMDFRYMLNIITSAIVNTPPPNGVITMVSTLATKVHKTMHYASTDETMLPLFAKDPDGTPRKHKFIMGRRNWCSVHWDEPTGDIIFDIRVEKEKGYGSTVGYAVRAPPPQWVRG